MRRGHSVDSVLCLVLFSLFTGSVLMVLMLGIQSYQAVVTSMEESYQERTYLQYIATKVTHYSQPGSVTITQFGDGDALELQEVIDGDQYSTYIYLHQGTAMELFCQSDVALDPQAGFPIMEVSELQLGLVRSNLLQVSCTGSGGTATVYVEICDTEEGAP